MSAMVIAFRERVEMLARFPSEGVLEMTATSFSCASSYTIHRSGSGGFRSTSAGLLGFVIDAKICSRHSLQCFLLINQKSQSLLALRHLTRDLSSSILAFLCIATLLGMVAFPTSWTIELNGFGVFQAKSV